jgi:hypothetical protein
MQKRDRFVSKKSIRHAVPEIASASHLLINFNAVSIKLNDIRKGKLR